MSSYRSVFTIPQAPETVIPRILSRLITWAESSFPSLLRPGGLDDFSPGMRFKAGAGVELIWIDQTLQSDDRLVGFVIIDSRGQGELIEQVMLAGGPRDPGMTVVSVEVGGLAVPDSASPRHPAPSVVNQLLAEFRCEDYGVVLTHSPLVLRTTDLDYLLKELSEIDHHVQVVVAATDNIDQVENTQETLRKIMAPATGMCATFVLDPQATRLFNERVTHSHAIEPGSLRIYVPGAQFGNPEDGNVHRKVDITAVLAGSDTGNLGADLCTGAAEFAASQTLARRERRYLSVLGAMLDDAVNGTCILRSAGAVEEPVTPMEGDDAPSQSTALGSSPVTPVSTVAFDAVADNGTGEAGAREEQDDSQPVPTPADADDLVGLREELVHAQRQIHEISERLSAANARIAQLEKQLEKERRASHADRQLRASSASAPDRPAGRNTELANLRQALKKSQRECQELRKEASGLKTRALAAEKRNRILTERLSGLATKKPTREFKAQTTTAHHLDARAPRQVTGVSSSEQTSDRAVAASGASPAQQRRGTVSAQRSGSKGKFFRPAVLDSSAGEYKECHSTVGRNGTQLRNAVRGVDLGARAELIAVVEHILAVESPVHPHRLGDLVRNTYGLASLHESHREALWDTLVATGHLVTDDLGFVWSIADQRLKEPVIIRSARRYALDHLEKIRYVHPHELAITLASVAQQNPRCTENDLFKLALGRLSRRNRLVTKDNEEALRRAGQVPRPGSTPLSLSVAQ